MNKKFSFKIGADPEFNITFKENRLIACKAIPILIKKGIPQSDMGYDIPGAGNVGWDGNSSTAEIRPNPSNEPQEVVKNMMNLLKTITEKTKLFSFDTRSKHEVVGGHIHMEIQDQTDKEMAEIHNKMSTLFLPILIGENNANVKNRLNKGYGEITDFRTDTQRNETRNSPRKRTYEFRAPTAEWLTTPKLANATLSYMGVIFNEILKNTLALQSLNSIMLKNREQCKAIQSLTIANFTPLITSLSRSIKEAIRKFELYPVFKEEIEYIFNPKRILRDKEKVNYDITAGWKLDYKTIPCQRKLMSDKLIEKISLETDMDNLIPIIPIMGSNDTNIDMFIRALKQRIIALNWKLKNNYYIFGLRNGIKEAIIGNTKGYFSGANNIKTEMDKKLISDLILKMLQRNQIKDTIIFGIPYKDRISYKLGIKTFIKNIYLIEKEILKQKKLEPLPNDDTGKLKDILVEPTNNIEDIFRIPHTWNTPIGDDNANENNNSN